MKHHNRLTCRDACCSHRGQQPDPPESRQPTKTPKHKSVPKLGRRKNTSASVVYGYVSVTFDLVDEGSSPIDVEVRFSLDHGETFRNCTPAPGSSRLRGMASCPRGAHQEFVWDSVADLGAGEYDDVLIMVLGGGKGGCVLPSVRVDNTRIEDDQ
jgi:hypothetical protein